MPPSYVKAYLKRNKNDANDAAAICEAVTRPSMRFVPIKTKEVLAKAPSTRDPKRTWCTRRGWTSFFHHRARTGAARRSELLS